MSERKRLEFKNILSPIPVGHRVEVVYMEKPRFLINREVCLIHDLDAGIHRGDIVDEALIDRLLTGAGLPEGWRMLRRVVGVVTGCYVHLGNPDVNGVTQMRTILDIDQEEVPTGEGWHAPRVLATQTAILTLHNHGLEQRWPGGMRHDIHWEAPFEVKAHRSPVALEETGLLDVHLRLSQRRDGRIHAIALTLALARTEALMALPELIEYLPRLQGAQAASLLEGLRAHAHSAGVALPPPLR